MTFDLGIIVPARRGSSRIAEKCLLPFGDEETLIEWKLAQLTQLIEPHRIYLSSEDRGFLELAERFGVRRHERARHLAIGHSAPFRDVITGIVRDIPHEHIAWATVVCPLMAPRDYAGGLASYEEHVVSGESDSLIAVNEARDYYWSSQGALNYRADREHTVSQELPDWFRVTNSLYMAPRSLILEREYFIGERPYLFSLPKLAGIDIDTPEDYRIARALYTLYQEEGGEISTAEARAA